MALNALQERGLKEVGDMLIQAFKEELLKQDHKVDGTLIDSFEQKFQLNIDGGDLLISMRDYGKYVDLGRRRGARGVPIFALMDWIIAKGIESDITKVKGIAFAIQKTIIKEGSPTSGSLKLRNPKTNFVDIAFKQKESALNAKMNEVITKSLVVTYENLIREFQTKFNNIN